MRWQIGHLSASIKDSTWLKSAFKNIIASAGRHQTCLPSWPKESSALAYARYVSSDFLWGPKVKFSTSILARHLYTRQLASEQSEGADFMTAQQRQGLQIKNPVISCLLISTAYEHPKLQTKQ